VARDFRRSSKRTGALQMARSNLATLAASTLNTANLHCADLYGCGAFRLRLRSRVSSVHFYDDWALD
jgi:hypothetical protein